MGSDLLLCAAELLSNIADLDVPRSETSSLIPPSRRSPPGQTLERNELRLTSMARAHIWLVTSLAGLALAQFPPKPEGVTVLRSKFHENVTLSFKEVSPRYRRVCPGVTEGYGPWNSTDGQHSARDLRDDAGREVLCGIRPPASWVSRRWQQRGGAGLSYQHVR